ncbi:glycosyltransferase family 2 protein [Apibacter muscae]|uniref:glycosyltransferase family 2 protein n=1 Tax=Apibacter muscae TaxID=2509004 RepID=UPI0011ADFC79|nr:glycosyltransferase family 2 protein [Apibacter muscae]TWP31193.1 glycosyltransferase family 2 protein [Apibacter muscae]
MDDIPLVSVIITFYNSGNLVHSAIKEVQKQTYKKIEIICVNDGFQDETLSLLKKYQQEDNRIIIINKNNEGGAHNALAAGQKVVKGKYILTFDHDDKLGEDAFEQAVVSMEQNPDWGISLFKVKIMDEDGDLLESRPQPKNILTAKEAVKATVIRFKYAFRCLYKREVFQSFSYYKKEP